MTPAYAQPGSAPASQDLRVRVDGRLYDVGKWRRYILVFFAATLSSTVILKIGDVQYLELIFAADILLLALFVLIDGLRIRAFRPFLEIAKSYGIFLVCAFLLSLFALDQNFATWFHSSVLKAPVLVTLARMAELSLDAFYMLYLASLFREDERLCIFGARTYLWAGIAGCIYSFVTLPLNLLFEAQLGTYTTLHRFRGFNNEGGGFGLYLVSVILLAVVMYRRKWISQRQFYFGGAILTLGFAGSQSKSAYVALVLLALIAMVWFLHGWKRWFVLIGLAASFALMATLFNLVEQVDQYRVGKERYQELSNLRPEDGNFVMGRVAGAVLAPRMIAARPLLGIGWGNYPLVRDDAEYRRGTAFAIAPLDAPSLGIIDYIVELGIPLWIYLTWVEMKPVFMLRRRRSDPWLIVLALIQPVSNWSGAHLNLIHPWVAAAFALGLAFSSNLPATSLPEGVAPASPHNE